MERGFENVFALEGGYNRWVDEKRPTDVKTAVRKGCLECHRVATPEAVRQWEESRHSKRDVFCTVCHGEGHASEDDVRFAEPVTPDRCIQCHAAQAGPFEKGRHARAWDVVQAVESGHGRPVKEREAECGPCHAIGLKQKRELQPESWQRGWEAAPCTACHGEHRFSQDRARRPETCRACHQGPGQPQWDMVADSPHSGLQSESPLAETTESGPYPTCQTCHMPEGDHLFRTAWGFWGLDPKEGREPDRTLLKALGFADETGAWTAQGKTLLGLGCFRGPTTGDFREDRQRMIAVCSECHQERPAKESLAQGDHALDEANRIMARALKAAEQRGITGPVLHPADRDGPVRNRLQEMFFLDRMNRFKGSFHLSPRYSDSLGIQRMNSGLFEIDR